MSNRRKWETGRVLRGRDYSVGSSERSRSASSTMSSRYKDSPSLNRNNKLFGIVLRNCRGGEISLAVDAGEEVVIKSLHFDRDFYSCMRDDGEKGYVPMDKVQVIDSSGRELSMDEVEITLGDRVFGKRIYPDDSYDEGFKTKNRYTRSISPATSSSVSAYRSTSTLPQSCASSSGSFRSSNYDLPRGEFSRARRNSEPTVQVARSIAVLRRPSLTRSIPENLIDQTIYGNSTAGVSKNSVVINSSGTVSRSSGVRSIMEISIFNSQRVGSGMYKYEIAVTFSSGNSTFITRCCHSFYNLLDTIVKLYPNFPIALPPMMTIPLENNYKQICILPVVIKRRIAEFSTFLKKVVDTQEFPDGAAILEAWTDDYNNGLDDLLLAAIPRSR